MLRDQLTRFAGDTSGELLKTTAKAAAIVGVFSIGCAYFLAERLEGEKRALSDLVAQISGTRPAARGGEARQGIDMSATGSIIRFNGDARLDPCATPRR